MDGLNARIGKQTPVNTKPIQKHERINNRVNYMLLLWGNWRRFISCLSLGVMKPTTSVKRFLREEFKKFNFKDYHEFTSVMMSDVKACKTCNVLYWEGALKRCECWYEKTEL